MLNKVEQHRDHDAKYQAIHTTIAVMWIIVDCLGVFPLECMNNVG
jgi:hypothetical protein